MGREVLGASERKREIARKNRERESVCVCV